MIPCLIVNRVKKVKLLFYFVQAVASSFKQLYEWLSYNSATQLHQCKIRRELSVLIKWFVDRKMCPFVFSLRYLNSENYSKGQYVTPQKFQKKKAKNGETTSIFGDYLLGRKERCRPWTCKCLERLPSHTLFPAQRTRVALYSPSSSLTGGSLGLPLGPTWLVLVCVASGWSQFILKIYFYQFLWFLEP